MVCGTSNRVAPAGAALSNRQSKKSIWERRRRKKNLKKKVSQLRSTKQGTSSVHGILEFSYLHLGYLKKI
jgi:hypothetical protein